MEKHSGDNPTTIVKTGYYRGADYPRGAEAATRRKTIRRMVIGGVAVAVVGALANGCARQETGGIPVAAEITAHDTPTAADSGAVAPETRGGDTLAMLPGIMPGPELSK